MKYILKKIQRHPLGIPILIGIGILFTMILWIQMQQYSVDIEHLSAYQLFRQNLLEDVQQLSQSTLFVPQNSQLLLHQYALYQQVMIPDRLIATTQLFFQGDIDVYLCLCYMILISYILWIEPKEMGYYAYFEILFRQKKKEHLKEFCFVFFSTFLLYLVFAVIRLMMDIWRFGWFDLWQPIQMVANNLYWPYRMSIFMGMVVWIGFIGSTLFMFTICLQAISRRLQDGKTYLVGCVVIAISGYLIQKIPYHSIFVVLKLMTWILPSMHFQQYHYVEQWGMIFPSYGISFGWYGIWILISFLIMKMPICFSFKKEQYHIGKPRSLLFLQFKKVWQTNMKVICTCLLIGMVFFFRQELHTSLFMRYSNQYLNQLEGFPSSSKQAWIQENTLFFKQSQQQLEQLKAKPFSQENQMQIYELENALRGKDSFEHVQKIYEQTKIFLLNGAMLKEILSRYQVLVFLLFILILFSIFGYHLKTIDHQLKTKAYFDSICHFSFRQKKMHRIIFRCLFYPIVGLVMIHILDMAEYFHYAQMVLKIPLICIAFGCIIGLFEWLSHQFLS